MKPETPVNLMVDREVEATIQELNQLETYGAFVPVT
jgi:hypothetical protein